jgi:replication factor C subunit 2/4
VPIDPEVISTLINTSAGDLRRSITYLQSASRLSTSTNPPSTITPNEIQEIAGVVPDNVINDFARALGVDVAGSMDVDDSYGGAKTSGFDRIKNKVKELMRDGYSASQILSQVKRLHIPSAKPLSNSLPQLHDIIVLHPTLTARQKSLCALTFAEGDKALCDGADEELWILEVGLQVHRAVS